MAKGCVIFDRLFNNYKPKRYKRFAGVPLRERIRISRLYLDPVYGYFIKRQRTSTRYLFPTDTEKRRLEMLADYILAEDHTKGLTRAARPKPADVAGDDEDYAPMGEGALRLSQLIDAGEELSAWQESRIKRCEVCEYEFIDESRNGYGAVCGERCRQRKDRLRKRQERFDDVRLKRDRERQDLEYSFYSPIELIEISKRGETATGADEIIRIEGKKRWHQVYAKKNEASFIDEKGFYGWVSEPRRYEAWRERAEPGPVVTKKYRPEAVERYLRTYYGEIPTYTSDTYSNSERG